MSTPTDRWCRLFWHRYEPGQVGCVRCGEHRSDAEAELDGRIHEDMVRRLRYATVEELRAALAEREQAPGE